MNKQAYEHIVGLSLRERERGLSKSAGLLTGTARRLIRSFNPAGRYLNAALDLRAARPKINKSIERSLRTYETLNPLADSFSKPGGGPQALLSYVNKTRPSIAKYITPADYYKHKHSMDLRLYPYAENTNMRTKAFDLYSKYMDNRRSAKDMLSNAKYTRQLV